MRVMVTFKFPAELGNELVKSGKVGKVVEQIMQELKPEAAYFYIEDGDRGGHIVINMTESSELAEVAERFFFGLGAKIQLRPVMAAEDLQKGLAGVETIVKNYA